MSNRQKPEIEGVDIVALGAFNPAIFQPLWFSNNNLIRKEEAESAKIEIIHRNAAIFSTEWFFLQVIEDRFSVGTSDPTKRLPLRDLALGTFKILEHTPINAFGFNMNQHYRMPSEEKWHSFGHFYAPKEPWNDILSNPGMRSLTMEGKREQSGADRVQVKIEPSVRVHPGVFIQVNQHYENKEEGSSPRDRIAKYLKTVQNSWEDFLTYCDTVAQHLLTKCESQTS